ncbi:MAG: PAS domain S-box protein [Ignavibacteriae bacterium]|nr:PAS domain S-box protein [Ignavibacteriota bacterium]
MAFRHNRSAGTEHPTDEERGHSDALATVDFATVLEALGDLVYVVDLRENRVASMSAALRTALGVDGNHLDADLLHRAIVHPDALATTLDLVRSALSTPGNTLIEFATAPGCGLPAMLRERCLTTASADGRPVQLVAVLTDISVECEKYADLQRGMEKYRGVYEDSAVGFVRVDGAYRICETNAAFAALTGYSQSELSSMTPYDFTHPDDIAREEMLMHAMMTEGRSSTRFEKRYMRKDGSVLWADVTVNIERDETGKPIEFVGFARDITGRRMAEHALRRSEERYRTLAEAAPDGIFIVDADEVLSYCNGVGAAIIGLTPEMAIGRKWESLLPRGGDAEAENSLRTLFSGADNDVRTGRISRVGARVYETLVVPMPAEDLELGPRLAIARDVTDRTAAEREIERWKTLYESVTAASGQIVYDYDVQSGAIQWGGSIDTVLGYSLEEMNAGIAQWSDLIHPEDRELSLLLLSQAEEAGSAYEVEYRFRHKSGAWVWFLDRGFFLDPIDGKHSRMVGMMTDVTAWKSAEQTLRENERRYRALFDLSPSGIIVEDAHGTILDINPSLSAAFGYGREELIGKNIRIVVPPDEHHLIDGHAARIIAGEVMEHEVMNIRKDGSTCWMELRETAMTLPDGSPGILSVANDVTLRREAKDALIAAKESAEKSHQLKDIFIANMSHEIRTPLNVIIGFMDLISEMYRDRIDAEHLIFFRTIERSGRRLLRTVEQILNISSIQAGTYTPRFETVNLVDVAESLATDMRPIAEAKGVALKHESTCLAAFSTVDRYTLEQALINLLDNAIKFTERGNVIISVAIEDAWARIDVADSGIGISDEYLPRIFEKFSQESSGTTRPFEGLGLGMALTRHYVEVSKGMISIDSHKGHGTVCTLFFPLDAGSGSIAGDSASGENSARNAHDAAARCVLVVEDDIQSQQYMSLLLSRHYNVRVASSAPQALEILNAQRIDIILMDISLHGDMDGLQFTQSLRTEARFSTLPIIALTAHAFPADRQRCFDAGCNEYLPKPFQREQLLALIAGFLK